MKCKFLLFFVQILICSQAVNAADVALFNLKALGGSVSTNLQVLLIEEREVGLVQIPSSVVLNIQNGSVVEISLEYSRKTTFDEIVRSVDKKYSKHKIHSAENKNNGAKISIWQVDKTYSIVAATNEFKQNLSVLLIKK